LKNIWFIILNSLIISSKILKSIKYCLKLGSSDYDPPVKFSVYRPHRILNPIFCRDLSPIQSEILPLNWDIDGHSNKIEQFIFKLDIFNYKIAFLRPYKLLKQSLMFRLWISTWRYLN
jgi:hypothetical protein